MRFPVSLFNPRRVKTYIRIVTKALIGSARSIAFASFSGMLINISGV